MADPPPQPQSPIGNAALQIPDATDFPVAIRDKYIVHGLYKDVKHSTLYSATHKQTASPVLIKSIHVDRVDSWKDLDLFITQSVILKNLEHPGIPKLFDAVDDTQNGRFHLVQEYIEAPSLKTILEEKVRLPVDLCLDIALQLCDILEALAAFSPPVVHRDIKPSNILLDAENKVHLIDFDLATARHTENRGSTVAGTVGYMPAEQYLGKAGTAADVYAVFATVLHLLTGVDPGKMDTEDFRLQFEPHLPPGTNPNLIQLFNDTLQPLEERRLTSLRTIRMRLEAILGKDAPDILWTGPFLELGRLSVPIRAKWKHYPLLLKLPPVPRPYTKKDLHAELDVLRIIIVFRAMIAVVLTLTLLLVVAKKTLIPIIFGIPLALFFARHNRTTTWTIDKLHDAICNWQQNTAVISGIEKLKCSFGASLGKSHNERYRIRFYHKLGNRTYSVEQMFAKLVIPTKNGPEIHIDPFQRCDGEVELKERDRVSILYDPKNPEIAIIFPGPLKNYLHHPEILR